MGRAETVELTCMCMICDGKGNVLVQDKRDSHWGGWNFPGGHVEKGEYVAEAVIREVFEETGLTVTTPTLCGIKEFYRSDGGGRYIVFLYRADTYTGELCPSEEGDIFWHPLDALDADKLAPNFEDMVKVFTDASISEVFYKRQGDTCQTVFL